MWVIKPFEELTAKELHLIYKERVAVFVVEQNCPYQEVDDTDLVSIHFWKQAEDAAIGLCPADSGSWIMCASDAFLSRKANAPMAMAKN